MYKLFNLKLHVVSKIKWQTENSFNFSQTDPLFCGILIYVMTFLYDKKKDSNIEPHRIDFEQKIMSKLREDTNRKYHSLCWHFCKTISIIERLPTKSDILDRMWNAKLSKRNRMRKKTCWLEKLEMIKR